MGTGRRETAGALEELGARVTGCAACPRLVAWREQVSREKRAAFRGETYWGRPVPGFGDPGARLLIVGLAPAAHGANRTGRMFTGDRSGEWLYGALHRAGFASRPESTARDDGLRLHDAWVTAAVRCAPPQNRPTREEMADCLPYLGEELDLLRSRLRCIVALGKIAFDQTLRLLRDRDVSVPSPLPRFSHGAEAVLGQGLRLVASYHPSQQNTFTGRLTREAFDQVWGRARAIVSANGPGATDGSGMAREGPVR